LGEAIVLRGLLCKENLSCGGGGQGARGKNRTYRKKPYEAEVIGKTEKQASKDDP